MVLSHGCTVGQTCFSQSWDVTHGYAASPRNSEAGEEKDSDGRERKEQRERERDRPHLWGEVYTHKLLGLGSKEGLCFDSF